MSVRSTSARHARRRGPHGARGRFCVLLAALALLGPGATVGHAAALQVAVVPATSAQVEDVDCATDAPPEGCGASVGGDQEQSATSSDGAATSDAGGPEVAASPTGGGSGAGAPQDGAGVGPQAAEGSGTDPTGQAASPSGDAQTGAAPEEGGPAQEQAPEQDQAPQQEEPVQDQPVQVQEVEELPTTLRLTPRETVRYGEDHAPSALLTSQEQPVAGAEVEFLVGEGSATGVTDDEGLASAQSPFVVDVPVGSQLQVQAVYDGQEGTYLADSDEQSLQVLLGECSLVNLTPADPLSSGQVQVSARFENQHGASAVGDREVVFSVQAGDAEPSTIGVLTGQDGVATDVVEVGELPVTVTAAFDGDDEFSPCAAEPLVVGAPVVVDAVTLTPVRSAAVVGTPHALTATVTDDDGLPVLGVPVVVRALAGPSAGAVAGPVLTDALGVAVLDLTSATLGTDVLVASVLPPPGFPDLEGLLLQADAPPAPLATSEEVTLSWVYASTGGGIAAEQADGTSLAKSLAGPGVTVSNVMAIGAASAFGTFTGGDGVVGFGGGIVMSTGQVEQTGPGTSLPSVGLGTPGDVVLDGLIGGGTHDAAVLSFDFVPASDEVLFRYVFASSEYSNFVNTSFNDIFVFQVNGKNCATLPGSGALVRINDVNAGRGGSGSLLRPPRAAPHLFMDNSGPERLLGTGLGGLTTVLTCRADVLVGQVNQMRLAIADVSDSSLDSAVFLQAESLVAVGRAVEVTPESGTSQTGGTATVLAGVFDDGAPVPGVPVTVVVSGAGQSLTSTLTTGPAGTVPFSWSRSAPGTDAVVATTAALSGGGVLGSTPRAWTWTQATTPPPVDPPPVDPPPVDPPPVDPPPVVPPPVDPPTVPVDPAPVPVDPPTVPVDPAPVPTDPAPTDPAPTLPEPQPVLPVPGGGGAVVTPVDPLTGRTLAPPSRPATALVTGGAFVDPLGAGGADGAADEGGGVADDAPPDVLPFTEPDPTTEPGSGAAPDGGDVLDVALDRPSTLPGGVAQVAGSGCPAGESVVLSVGGERVAGTTADSSGRFEATLDLPRLEIGVHEVEARCGELVQSVPLTLVVGSSVGGAAAAASTVGVVLAFFVLLATMFLLNGPGAPSPAALATAAQAAREDEQDDDEDG